MYDASLSYEENLRRGPQEALVAGGRFPRVRFDGEPRFSFLGIPVHIPFGIPAGPLFDSSFVRVALAAGFSVPVFKTVRTRAWPPQTWPDRAAIEHDEPSPSPDVWRDDILSLSWERGFAPVVSFQGSCAGAGFDGFLSDTLLAARLAGEVAWEAGARILELNLNGVGEGGIPLFRERDRAVALVKSVATTLARVSPSLRLVVRVGCLSEVDTVEFLRKTAGILHGISATPTADRIPGGDLRRSVPGAGDETGGDCGALVFERALEMVRRLEKARRRLGLDDLALVAVGGVRSAREFVLYREAGAQVVQAATGAMWNLGLAQEVAEACGVRWTVEDS